MIGLPVGESLGTLFAILDYAEKYRPCLVILENICAAPWNKVEKAWNEIGYTAKFARLDTKSYYLPHTRQRGYMLCIDSNYKTDDKVAEAAGEEWKKKLRDFERRASSSVEAFLMDAEDPRLHAAMNEIVNLRAEKERQSSREVIWSLCKERYAKFRQDNRLGFLKPATDWVPNGYSTMPDYANIRYMRNQVDRVKDTFDIIFLLAARDGWDLRYKP
jgi:site-specific DNA-cytosine methylase